METPAGERGESETEFWCSWREHTSTGQRCNGGSIAYLATPWADATTPWPDATRPRSAEGSIRRVAVGSDIYSSDSMCSMHRKDLITNTQETATPRVRVRPGSPAPAVAMAVVRCTRTVTRSYAVGYARRPVRAVTANTRTQNAKLTHNRRLAAGGPRGSAARRVARSVTVCMKVVLKASLPSIRRGCYILVRTCDLHLSMHLRNLIMPCPCCPFDSSTVTRDGGRGTDTRLML